MVGLSLPFTFSSTLFKEIGLLTAHTRKICSHHSPNQKKNHLCRKQWKVFITGCFLLWSREFTLVVEGCSGYQSRQQGVVVHTRLTACSSFVKPCNRWCFSSEHSSADWVTRSTTNTLVTTAGLKVSCHYRLKVLLHRTTNQNNSCKTSHYAHHRHTHTHTITHSEVILTQRINQDVSNCCHPVQVFHHRQSWASFCSSRWQLFVATPLNHQFGSQYV